MGTCCSGYLAGRALLHGCQTGVEYNATDHTYHDRNHRARRVVWPDVDIARVASGTQQDALLDDYVDKPIKLRVVRMLNKGESELPQPDPVGRWGPGAGRG